MALVLRRNGGQQIRIVDPAGHVLWIQVYRRSPHSPSLDFSFTDPDKHFKIHRGELVEDDDR